MASHRARHGPSHLPFSSRTLALLSFLLATSSISVQASADAHKRDDFSFRGPVPEDLHIPHWDISGSADRIPTAKDFIRLVQPFPLAYGAMFTEKPIPFDQWSVEIAFRIHGGYSNVHHGHHNQSLHDDDDDLLGKGGRGIALWYTKTANPTPIVSPANPHHHSSPRPPLAVAPHPDPLDSQVSFFGGPTSFDGLAVVIDNMPSTPLTARSDRRHWSIEEGGSGAEEWAVVSGIMDDGKGRTRWLEDRMRTEMDEDEEAEYLNHTIGDCQVALRNAAGMVWMKVTHIEGHLSVSLDLLPHTTLSGEERHYKRECFSASNVKLPRGYYLGLTGLASPNEEADNIDIYAIEVKEIKGRAKTEEEVVEHYKEEHVAADDVKLEGTSKGRDQASMAQEALNAQRNWADAVRQMSQKIDHLNPIKDAPSSEGGTTHHAPPTDSHQLNAINAKLDSILHKLSTGEHTSSGLSGHEKSTILDKILDMEEQSNRHEMFLSEQIEELRHLLLNPPPPTYHEEKHFKPLETLHEQTPESGRRWVKPTGSVFGFLSWTVAILVVFLGGYKLGTRRGRKNRFEGDEGSFVNSSNSALAMTMDTLGFRQRGSKKMI